MQKAGLQNKNKHEDKKLLLMLLQYDKNHSGALEFEELHAVLADLGILVKPCLTCFPS